jgi:hypothetical protein
LALFLLMATGAAERALAAVPFDDLIGDPDKDWTEIPPELPAAVDNAALIGFYVSPTTSFRFAVDGKSITLGKDGVIHYTLVGTSDEGARNVRFQGIRCATRTFKTYAYGRGDGSWTAARDPAWARIDEAESNRQLAALYKDIICKDGLPQSLAQVIARLRQNPYASLPK